MRSSNRNVRSTTRAAATASLQTLLLILAACGPAPIRVMGVMQHSTEMRPLPSVPLGGYQQLRLLVRAASGQAAERVGSADCGYATLEGTEEGQDRRNAACVPTEALNTGIGFVRQRLRSYGITVARDASEPYDYTVEVSVTGQAPKKADVSLAKAVARVAFKLHAGSSNTLVSGIDRSHTKVAFDAISRNCALPDAAFEEFSASSAQPMTPGFDIVALSSDAVDNLLRCYDLANFFLDARNRQP